MNNQYSKQLQQLTNGLSQQLKNVLHLNSSIQMPQNLNTLFRDLTFLTSDEYVKGIDLNHRGDGIKARHIPSILRYMQKNIEENRPKGAIISSFVWGFEEPENGVEYLSCFEMADELYSYKDDCQILITTHSPAFYMKSESEDTKCFFVYKNDNGASKYTTDKSVDIIDEKIGFLPLVAPYIKREKDLYLEREKTLKMEYESILQKYNSISGKIIIITEGKTDTRHIKVAFEHLELDESIINKIDYYDLGNSKVLGEDLKNLLDKLQNIPRENIVIGIFDRDKGEFFDNNRPYKKMKNRVFKTNIPALENEERKINDKICIEHYYTNREIKTKTENGRLYMGDDFTNFGVSNDNMWIFQNYEKNKSITPITIIDSDNKHLQRIHADAQIISKNDFALYVEQNPNKFDFTNFKKIFELIKQIQNDVQ